MGAIREVDAISEAIMETEKEIAGNAWDIEDTEALDATGDRSLEDMGEGLEGQHEAGDETDELEAEGEDADGEGEGGEPGEGEGETEQPLAAQGQGQEQQPPQGRVPSAKLREANDRARAAEAERDRLREQLKAPAKDPEFDTLKAQVATLTQLLQGQQRPPATETRPEPVVPPDIFENPTGFVEHVTQSFQSELQKRDQALRGMQVETSFAIAHAVHKDAFEEAMGEVNKLNVQNPDDRATVQRIYNAPNPGQALVAWHKRNKTFAAVGADPAAYAERIRNETRESLMKDPEFIKQVAESMRSSEMNGADGRPRTTTRLPRSLNGASGSNIGAARLDPRALDDSEQAVASSAWD